MTKMLDIPGVGKIDKEEYMIVLDLDETLLLSRLGQPLAPKVWVTRDEWEGRVAEQEPPAEMPKFKSFKEALAAFADKNAEEEIEETQDTPDLDEFYKAPEGSLYPLQELEKLRLDELLVIMVMAYGEDKVREKLYAVDGHCPKGKKCGGSCKPLEKKDVDS